MIANHFEMHSAAQVQADLVCVINDHEAKKRKC